MRSMDMDAAGPLMVSMFFVVMALVTVGGLVWAAAHDG